MKRMNLYPAFRYRALDSLKGAGAAIVAVAAVVAALTLIAGLWIQNGEREVGSFGGFSMSMMVMTFVFGISTVRSDLRLFLQNGIGRASTFAADLLAAAVVSFALAVAGELLTVAVQSLPLSMDFKVMDLYQMTFAGGQPLSLGGHLMSGLLTAALTFSAHLGGMLISLIYARLSKRGAYLFSFALGFLLMFGIPFAGERTAEFLMPFLSWMMNSAENLVGTLAGLSLVTALPVWLLLRHAPLKAGK
ncbi:MAG: hypothetical protein RRZ93_06525 [Ruthenibacterium sp.]